MPARRRSRPLRAACIPQTAALTALAALPAAAAAAAPTPTPAVQPFTLIEPRADGAVLALDVAALDGLPQRRPFVIERFPLGAGATADLEVRRFRVTGPDTRFVVGRRGAEDRVLDFDADRVALLRGRVAGRPGSHVFLALSESGSVGRLELGAGEQYVLRPSSDGALALTRGASGGGAPPEVPLCGLSAAGAPAPAALRRTAAAVPVRSLPAGEAGGAPPVTRQIELAIETDHEFFELFGDLDAAGSYVVELFGAVSDIYLRDVNSRVYLTFVRLWDTPDDLFNEPDPLVPFREHWEANMEDVPRDAAQFVSGRRDLPYGGVAYLSALCTDFAYSVVGYAMGLLTDLSEPSVFHYDVKVTAHELGHNCGTLHTHDYGLDTCNILTGPAQRGTIMSYCSQTRSGGNANSDLRFHATVQDFMEQFIFGEAGCLAADCNGNDVPDASDIAIGTSQDVNGDGIPDECQDCNGNDVLDPLDISGGGSDDVNLNGVPDECEDDCDGNGVPDAYDVALGNVDDLNANLVPDGCETDCDGDGAADYNEIQADMTLDIDRNAALDACQDCDGDGTSDLEALAGAHNAWVASSETGSGLREFHALSGVRMSTGETGFLDDPQDLIITPGGRILVSSGADDRIVEFAPDGSYAGDLVTAGSGGLDLPAGLVLAPDGSLLAASRNTDSVLAYDADTGAPLGAFVAAGAGGLTQPFGIAFSAAGNLFVTSGDGRVIEYDGGTGDPVGDFVTAAGNGGLTDPRGLLFTPDGDLLVASLATNQILEYDGASGAFLGQFNHGGTDEALTLDQPWSLRLGPDGHVYASRHDVEVPAGGGGHHDEHDDVAGLHINSTRIYVFDVESGNFFRSYVTGHDTGLSFPTAFDFMPGDATDCNFNQIPDGCDIADGTSEDANGDGVPDECAPPCPWDLDGSGAVGTPDFLDLLAQWGTDPGGPPDFDGDGTVGTPDFLALLANWGACRE